MYNNVGKKIKDIVSAIATFEIVASIIVGFIVSSIDFEELWWLGLIIIAVGIFNTWITYLFMFAFGELVDKTTNIEALLRSNSVKHGDNSSKQTVVGPDEWQCPKCGTINQNYVGTCACGQENPDGAVAVNPTDDFLNKIKNIPAVKEQTRISLGESSSTGPQPVASSAVPYRIAGPNEWQCSKCGAINQNYVGTCGCGQTKAEN